MIYCFDILKINIVYWKVTVQYMYTNWSQVKLEKVYELNNTWSAKILMEAWIWSGEISLKHENVKEIFKLTTHWVISWKRESSITKFAKDQVFEVWRSILWDIYLQGLERSTKVVLSLMNVDTFLRIVSIINFILFVY